MPNYETALPLVLRRYCGLWGRGTRASNLTGSDFYFSTFFILLSRRSQTADSLNRVAL